MKMASSRTHPPTFHAHIVRPQWFLAHAFTYAVCIAASTLMSGCAAVGVTALGVGAAAGVSHTLGGIVYKTFTEPMPKVKRSTLTALKRMDIAVECIQPNQEGELIKAKASNRAIEVQLESLTPKTTRMRVTADSDGFLKDSATATEIILQTERVLPAT